ncbi:MAG: ATP-binding cassette domain-containing protein, partial [Streptosporangiales bacterium]|nr:ATP-binding cassette domain-containing protein [Streptosporangiales bacterium]
LLDALGLDTTTPRRKPAQLSGGQLQRCALARALLAHPRLLICDEVTSALDTINTSMVLQKLRNTADQTGTALALISHDLDSILPHADHVMVMDQGRRID